MKKNDKFYNTKELSGFLGITEQTLSNWRAKKINLAYIVVGKKIMYLRSDVEKFIDQSRVLPATVPGLNGRYKSGVRPMTGRKSVL